MYIRWDDKAETEEESIHFFNLKSNRYGGHGTKLSDWQGSLSEEEVIAYKEPRLI